MRIGIFLIGDPSWMGGVYYILNILRLLSISTNAQNRKLIVFYSRNIPTEVIDEVSGMNNVKMIPVFGSSPVTKAINWVCRVFLDWNWWLSGTINREEVDLVYPLLEFDSQLRLNARKIYWIYDFQHVLLPEFFSDEEILLRDEKFQKIADKGEHVVLSSYDARSHFTEIFPNSKIKTHVYQFSSVIDESKLLSKDQIKAKYQLTETYFMVCNQFWKHKNHELVFQAMDRINSESLGHAFKVVFTGRMIDDRNVEYIERLKKIASDSKLKNAEFLGFISREDQLSLMKFCRAVIQPSRFEGWGTVVEDAKSLGVPIIASDIPVHREQLPGNSNFFDVDNEEALAELIVLHSKGEQEDAISDHSNNIAQLETIFNQVID